MIGKKAVEKGEERYKGKEEGGGEEGEKKKTADATQLELSVVNEPRCLRDKEDECVCVCVFAVMHVCVRAYMCVCDLILSVSLKD